ncbi:Abi family protein [Microbacterium sp. NPDC087592]|uniref:Abi family protein n=1 Tax=Microbacterium sp. NPDC087592 TaxID=3364193 RepID=UPI0038280D41
MDAAVSRYAKPFTSVPEQVELLRRNGMVIDDAADAAATLRRCGYYRLSGYTHYFREGPSLRRFMPGTTLREVTDLYRFDETLRAVILDGIAQLEPALRFHVGHRLGRNARFAHRRGVYLSESGTVWAQGLEGTSRSKHASWLQEYGQQESRSQETFVQHFRRRYGPHLPVWVATEVMTLGTLTRLYDLMPDNDRKLVALRFGLRTKDGDGDPGTFSNWLNFIRHVRNICAHHSRLWNRTLDVSLTRPGSGLAPELAHIDDSSRRRLYGVISALRYLLARVEPESHWHSRALTIVTDFARTSGVRLSTMGFPRGWQNESLWAPNYLPDMLLREVADSVDAVDTVNRPTAMLLVEEKGDEAARKDWLRYLVREGALIAHRMGPQQHFPVFQFRNGNVYAPAANVNVNLFSRIERTEKDPSRAAIAAQRWWTTADPSHGFEDPPLDMLNGDPEIVTQASTTWANGTIERIT